MAHIKNYTCGVRVSFLKKIILLPVLLLTAVLFVADVQAAAAAGVLKIGADCTYPPFNYKDSSGAWKGFDVDIANEIAHRLNMQPQHDCVTWDGLIPGLLSGRYDVIIAAMDITPERAKRVDFSVPYYRAPAAFVGPETMKNAPITDNKLSADFLKNKTVGLLRASIYEKYLLKTYPGIQLERYDTMDNVLIDLKAGRIDLAFTDMAKAQSDFLHQSGNNGFTFIGPKVEDYAILGEGSAAAVRKGNTILLDKINAAIKSMMADGTYDKISRHYWSFSVKP